MALLKNEGGARFQELEGVIERNLKTFYEVGKALQEIRDSRLYKKEYKSFEEYCQKRWEFGKAYANRLIESSDVIENLAPIGAIPATEYVARELAPASPAVQREAWALATSETQRPTAKVVREAVQKVSAGIHVNSTNGKVHLPLLKERGLYIPSTLDIAKIKQASNAVFNNQGENENIEWAHFSWNPVTGCLHGCDFCYARDISFRFYEQKFAPTFLPERLAAPRNTPLPDKAKSDVGWRNVFVCSMADLWGKWVPREIIDLVLDEVRTYKQWNYLFLTKFPARYEEFAGELPKNAWMGTTVVEQANVDRAEHAFKKLKDAGHKGIRWLSVEPMYERITFKHLKLFDWIVVGGASASSQTPAFVPPIEWYEHLHNQAKAAGCRFYMKSNIRLREYPSE